MINEPSEDMSDLRGTVRNFERMKETAIEKNQKYEKRSLLNLQLHTAKNPLRHHKSCMQLTEEQRRHLDEMEHW